MTTNELDSWVDGKLLYLGRLLLWGFAGFLMVSFPVLGLAALAAFLVWLMWLSAAASCKAVKVVASEVTSGVREVRAREQDIRDSLQRNPGPPSRAQGNNCTVVRIGLREFPAIVRLDGVYIKAAGNVRSAKQWLASVGGTFVPYESLDADARRPVDGYVKRQNATLAPAVAPAQKAHWVIPGPPVSEAQRATLSLRSSIWDSTHKQ